MEWVETTGRTIEDAKDAALDQLGIDEAEAEFEIIEEPKAGLFGRIRREARVRARIEPTQPRPKADRRDRRRRGPGKGKEASKSSGSEQPKADKAKSDRTKSSEAKAGAAAGGTGSSRGRSAGEDGGGGSRERARGGSSASSRSGGKQRTAKTAPEGASDVSTEIDAAQQGEIVAEFLEGLVDAFDLSGEVTTVEIDEETVEVQVSGEDLGLMIGPKGQTLASIQDLARTVVQRQADGGSRGRVRIDVSGYRERRRVALERFTRGVAEEVQSSGVQKALEPMGAADRKVVHDTVNELDGVSTISEGEEPRRRVVILPDA